MSSVETVASSNQRHMHLPLAALHAVEATTAYFKPTDIERRAGSVPEVELVESERTPEGFIELGWDHLETQRSLHMDLRYACEGPVTTWPDVMQSRARDALDTMNKDRTDPVSMEAVSPTVLFRLAEPRWPEQTSDVALELWPEEFHADLLMLRTLDDKLKVLSQDSELQQQAQEIWQERTEVMRTASAIIRNEQKQEDITRRIANIRMQVSATPGQQLSIGKQRQIASLESRLTELQSTWADAYTDETMKPALIEEVERRSRQQARREYERGLVMTEPMKRIIHEMLPSIIKGNPALLVGETGGAKTALAKFIARELMGKEPEIISGYADVNGYQLIGKTGLASESSSHTSMDILDDLKQQVDWDALSEGEKATQILKARELANMKTPTFSEFMAGPVIRAMEEGRPLILDEINAMPPEFLKRLNEITQLRPGDTMSIQEDSGRIITVKQGFCIIATANEKSRRYTGVHDLSTEFRNRFTANTYRVHYPDSDVVTGRDPLDNYKLAYGAVCGAAGNLLFAEGADTLETFARAAHTTQRLFTGFIRDGLSEEERDLVGTDRLSSSDATGLDDNVIAPRTMAALLEKVVDSQGSITLETVLSRWVESIKNPHDKKTIKTILSTHGLISKSSQAQKKKLAEDTPVSAL